MIIAEVADTETKQESDEPNAFDKVKADENDEGKTGAKVSSHDLQ